MALDLEYQPKGDGTYYPLPADYVGQVSEAIETATALQSRRPILYSSPDFLWNWCGFKNGKLPPASWLDCPLWIADWRGLAAPGYQPWSQFAFWQKKGNMKDWPGISAMDLDVWPGDRTQLKAWCADARAGIPGWSGPPAPATETWATVVGTNLRLRHVPSLSGDVMGRMAQNATFRVVEKREMDGYTWARLDSGWIATGPGLAVLDERQT